MNIIDKYINLPIDRFFSKTRHKYDRNRTIFELNNYWAAAARNIAPVTISEDKSGEFIRINKKTVACCIICGIPIESENGYPEEMDDAMITKLVQLASRGNRIAYSLKLKNIDTYQARKDIQSSIYMTQVNADEAENAIKKKKNISMQDMDTKVAQDHNESNYRDVTENKHKIFDSSFIITIWAQTREQLQDLKSDVTLILENSAVKYEIPDYYHLKTYFAAQPFNTNPAFSEVRILSPYAAMLTSARSPNSKTDQDGLWFGTDRTTGKEIIFNPNKMIAPHAIGVGPTGSGKTASIFGYVMRLLALNYTIIYITPKDDPNTSHRSLVDFYGPDIATLIDISPKKSNINPLQIIYDQDDLNDDVDEYKYAFNKHKEIFIRFMEVWFQDTGTPNMAGLLDSTLNAIYKNKGISYSNPSSWINADWPVMSDMINELKRKIKAKLFSADEYKTAGAIINKTISFDKDGILGYMNNPTTVDFSKRLLMFDLSEIPPKIQDPMNVLITAICGQLFRTKKEKTIIIVDEARVFLTNKELTEFLLQTLTMGRSANVSLWILTQQPSDLTKADVAEEFITNASLKFVYGTNIQDENIEIVNEHFKLNKNSSEYLLNSTVGDMILIINNQQIPLHVQLTELELAIINNRLNNGTQEAQGVIRPGINPVLEEYVMEHGFCMDEWADKFNLDNWKMERVQDTFKGAGMATAWVNKDILDDRGMVTNQSLDHYSSVIQIGAYLLKKGIENVNVDDYTGPDVTFTITDENGVVTTHAIEFEIEGTHTKEQVQDKRKRWLTEYDNIYFVSGARYKKKLSNWIGPQHIFSRGSQLKNLLDGITE